MGLLPKLLLLSSEKGARPGMLGEPLLGHLACHLPTSPESYFPIPQLTVHICGTLRGRQVSDTEDEVGGWCS